MLAFAAGSAGPASAVRPPLVGVQLRHHHEILRFQNQRETVIVVRRIARPGGKGYVTRWITLKPSLRQVRTVDLGRFENGSYSVTLRGPGSRTDTLLFAVR